MVQIGLKEGARAALDAAQKMGIPVSKEYAQKMQNLPSESYAQGTVDFSTTIDTSQPNPQMQNLGMPLRTFEKFGVPIETRDIMMRNTRPVDYSIYSVAAASSAPMPYVVESQVQYGAQLPEEMRGGILGNGRRGIFMQPESMLVEKKNPVNAIIDAIEQVPRREKVVSLEETEQEMIKQSQKSMRDFAIKYDLGQSNLNISTSPDQGSIPVVTTSGKTIGSTDLFQGMMPQQGIAPPTEQYPVTGIVAQPAPNKSVVPMVNLGTYDGLDSYFESAPPSSVLLNQSSRNPSSINPSSNNLQPTTLDVEPNQSPNFIPVDPLIERDKRPHPINTFLSAWTSPQKTAAQTAIIVSTVIAGLLLVILLLVGLVALAQQDKKTQSMGNQSTRSMTPFPPPTRRYVPAQVSRRAPLESSWMQRLVE